MTEIPCGHCRQVLQELPHAKEMRIIVKKAGIDSPLSELLPYSFELPIDGVIHHVFESATLVDAASMKPRFEAIMTSLKCHTNMNEHIDSGAVSAAWNLFSRSFSWYSGCPAIALFFTEDGRVTMGSMIESSAYNPTVNPLQVVA